MLVLSLAACADRRPTAIARAADAKTGTTVYTWLADHDPSSIVSVGLDRSTVQAVAPDAHVYEADGAASGCPAALARHALLAERAALHTAERDRARDCGFALFHDDASVVIAPERR